MKILALARDIPATSAMPGSPRFFHFCKELSEKHQLVLLTFSPSQERQCWFDSDSQSRGVFTKIINLPNRPRATWWNRQRHRISLSSHLLGRYLYPNHYQAICDTVQQVAETEAVDLLYVDGLQMTQYIFSYQGAPAVVDLADSLTLLFQRTAAQEKKLVRKLALSLECLALSRWEKKLAKHFPLVVTISKADEAAIRSLNPKTRLAVIPNGVDTEFFSYQKKTVQSSRLVFTGVMGYGPNEDAALYFAEEIFPLVQARRSEVEFWIVGDCPSERIKALEQNPAIHVTGTVPDIRPFVWDAAVYVSPLRYGTGIKNKILTALSLGTPLVATSISIDGIDVQPETHVLVGDKPQEFAKQVLRLLENPSLASKLSSGGRNVALEHYSWKKFGKMLEEELIAVTNR